MTATKPLDQLHRELAAIQTGAAIFPLTDSAFLRITGPDATRWLNGMVTNNITALTPGQGNFNFLLNAQGRIQGTCTIYRELGDEPTYLLETDDWQLETIRQTLDRFIIMDDVELSPIEAHGTAILGSKAYEVFCSAMLPPNVSPGAEPKPSPLLGYMYPTVLIGPKAWTLQPATMRSLFYEVWSTEPSDIMNLSAKLLSLGATEVSAQALEAHRILSGIPRYGQDIRNSETARDLPQETAQTHALHFAKGCYLGQEIVERIHSRGQVHRLFTQFTLTGDLPTLPAPLTANTKPAGELTSAIRIGDQVHALGYLRREFLTTPLTYPGGTATPKPLTTNH